METSGGKSFPLRKVIDLLKKMQVELTQDAANDWVIMDKMDCGCVSNRKEMTESTATTQKQIVYVTVPPNPEQTVEVMKLVSQERVQRRTVEQVMDVPVTMHVEAGQAQYIHRGMDVPVVGVPVHGQAAAQNPTAATPGSARRE